MGLLRGPCCAKCQPHPSVFPSWFFCLGGFYAFKTIADFVAGTRALPITGRAGRQAGRHGGLWKATSLSLVCYVRRLSSFQIRVGRLGADLMAKFLFLFLSSTGIGISRSLAQLPPPAYISPALKLARPMHGSPTTVATRCSVHFVPSPDAIATRAGPIVLNQAA